MILASVHTRSDHYPFAGLIVGSFYSPTAEFSIDQAKHLDDMEKYFSANSIDTRSFTQVQKHLDPPSAQIASWINIIDPTDDLAGTVQYLSKIPPTAGAYPPTIPYKVDLPTGGCAEFGCIGSYQVSQKSLSRIYIYTLEALRFAYSQAE